MTIKKDNVRKENLYDFLIRQGLKITQADTLGLLKKVSKGKDRFKTTYEELAENFFDNYREVKKVNAQAARNLRTRIRCRLKYFVDEWQKRNNKVFFKIESIVCSDGCSSKHTVKHPNPDILTIKLYFG